MWRHPGRKFDTKNASKIAEDLREAAGYLTVNPWALFDFEGNKKLASAEHLIQVVDDDKKRKADMGKTVFAEKAK